MQVYLPVPWVSIINSVSKFTGCPRTPRLISATYSSKGICLRDAVYCPTRTCGISNEL